MLRAILDRGGGGVRDARTSQLRTYWTNSYGLLPVVIFGGQAGDSELLLSPYGNSQVECSSVAFCNGPEAARTPTGIPTRDEPQWEWASGQAIDVQEGRREGMRMMGQRRDRHTGGRNTTTHRLVRLTGAATGSPSSHGLPAPPLSPHMHCCALAAPRRLSWPIEKVKVTGTSAVPKSLDCKSAFIASLAISTDWYSRWTPVDLKIVRSVAQGVEIKSLVP